MEHNLNVHRRFKVNITNQYLTVSFGRKREVLLFSLEIYWGKCPSYILNYQIQKFGLIFDDKT